MFSQTSNNKNKSLSKGIKIFAYLILLVPAIFAITFFVMSAPIISENMILKFIFLTSGGFAALSLILNSFLKRFNSSLMITLIGFILMGPPCCFYVLKQLNSFGKTTQQKSYSCKIEQAQFTHGKHASKNIWVTGCAPQWPSADAFVPMDIFTEGTWIKEDEWTKGSPIKITTTLGLLGWEIILRVESID